MMEEISAALDRAGRCLVLYWDRDPSGNFRKDLDEAMRSAGIYLYVDEEGSLSKVTPDVPEHGMAACPKGQ